MVGRSWDQLREYEDAESYGNKVCIASNVRFTRQGIDPRDRQPGTDTRATSHTDPIQYIHA